MAWKRNKKNRTAECRNSVVLVFFHSNPNGTITRTCIIKYICKRHGLLQFWLGLVLARAFGIVWPRQKIDLNTRDMRLTFALGARRQNKNRKQPHTPTTHTHTVHTPSIHTPAESVIKAWFAPFWFWLGFLACFLLCTHTPVSERVSCDYFAFIFLIFLIFLILFYLIFFLSFLLCFSLRWARAVRMIHAVISCTASQIAASLWL